MIVYFPFLLFAAGTLVAYGSTGLRRQAATIATVAASGWSLVLLVDPGSGTWAIGPVVATLLLPRAGQRAPSNFEGLTRRVVTLAVAVLVALFLATRLPIGENPILLSAVPWLLGALGTAWFVSPIDEPERLQGQALMIAAVAVLILIAVPTGPLTAGVAGAMALMPIAGERGRIPGRLRPAVSGVLLLAAGAAAALAVVGPAIRPFSMDDLSFDVGGPVLLATAIVLVAGSAVSAVGTEWAALVAVLALIASAPGLRWSALAALVAVATGLERSAERPAWLAVGVLSAVPVLQALASPSWSARVQAVALAVGLVLTLLAATTGMRRVLVLPAITLSVMLALSSLSTSNLVRFQWIAAFGAALLIAQPLLTMLIGGSRREVIRDRLLFGLLLLAIGARDSLGLGELAVVLLLVDLAIVRIDHLPAASDRVARMVFLARSNWPPSATFAGATLAVIGALQASLVLGLLAAIMLAALQLAPLLDRHALAPGPERPRSSLRWIGPVVSIACGIAPALVLRMLRL